MDENNANNSPLENDSQENQTVAPQAEPYETYTQPQPVIQPQQPSFQTQPIPQPDFSTSQPLPTPQSSKNSGLSIASLVMAFIFFPIGLILGIICLLNAKKSKTKDKFALAAVIISSFYAAISIIFICIFVPIIIDTFNKCKELGEGTHVVGAVTYTCSGIGDSTNNSNSSDSVTPTANTVKEISYAGYKPNSVNAEQMEGEDAISNSKQTISFKISSDWVFDEEISDNYYSGDLVYKKDTGSGDALFSIYTRSAISNADDAMSADWKNIDEVTEEYIESQSASLSSQTSTTIGDKYWSILMFNDMTSGKNANMTTLMAIDDKGNFTDLVYIAEIITPKVMSENDFNNIIKDVKYTLASLTSDAE